MSYYANHFPYSPRAFHPFATQAQAQAYHPSSPRHETPYVSLEEEERAALAHLRAIQNRREAAQREAEARARAQVEQEIAFRRYIETEARRAAIREKEREEAYLSALRAEEARRRQVAEIQRARQVQVQARANLIAEFQAAKRAQWEAMRSQKAAACAARCARRFAGAHAQRNEHKEEFDGLNALLGGLFGINLVEEEAKEDKKEEGKEKSEVPAPAPAPAPAADPAATEKVPVEIAAKSSTAQKETPEAESNGKAFPEDINALLSQFLGLRVEPSSDSTTGNGNGNGQVPPGLNNFLSQFGLVFEPDTPAEAPIAGPSETKSTETKVAEKKVDTTPLHAASSAANEVSTPAPAPTSAPKKEVKVDDTPLTSFLNGVTDLPPFVRDILGNIEMSWKEESAKASETAKKDKGKGVAVGEKTERVKPTSAASPAPAPAPTSAPAVPAASAPVETAPVPEPSTSLAKLSDISSELSLAVESFTFPSHLSFAPSETASAPALLFNKTNSPYHAQANKLLQLLLAADGVSSGGDKTIRHARKELVRKVEGEIQSLEKRRDLAWEETKLRRESGYVSEDEGERSSNVSTVDVEEVREEHVEHIEHADTPVEAEAKADEKEVQGFEVPAAKEDEQVPASAPDAETKEEKAEDAQAGREAEAESQAAKVEDVRDVEAPADKEKEKEDEFELL